MSFALVKTDIAPLYAKPTSACELTDEALHGMKVEILEKAGSDWYRVRTHYRYEGYVNARHLEFFDACVSRWEKSDKLAVSAAYVDIQSEPSVSSACLVSVPLGGLLVPTDAPDGEQWQKVYIADGRAGYTKSSYLSVHKTTWDKSEEKELRRSLVLAAKKYLGVQYRWGGKTPLGIDCSGLTSIAYMQNGVLIYRDAAIKDGFEMHEIDPACAKKGDLLFFPGHVAMYIGDGKYIHSTAYAGSEGVVINSLNQKDADFRADLAEKLTCAGSIF